jgi:hypothetical protein
MSAAGAEPELTTGRPEAVMAAEVLLGAALLSARFTLNIYRSASDLSCGFE